MQLIHKLRQFQMFPKRYGILPYVFVVYILMPAFILINETGWKAIFGYVMLALFLISYRQFYFSIMIDEYQYPVWLIGQMLIIFIFGIFYNPNLLFLGFFPANFIGWFPKNRHFYSGLIMLWIIELVPLVYHLYFTQTTYNLYYLFPFIIIMLFIPFGIRSMGKRMELEKQLERANAKIDKYAKREERMRIARDLHDTLGHTLSLITLKSQLIERLTTVDPERIKLEAKEIEKTSRAALKQVRELVSDMRAVKLSDELIEIKKIFQTAGVIFNIELDVDFDEITPLTQNIISMCLKESTTNVIKHSQAKQCSIKINQSSSALNITVEDNGIGFVEKDLNGNGLSGMKERLALIDGELFISSQNGTIVKMKIPIVQKSEKAGAVL
ncbi:sensor histidine kinase [Alkalihalobacillus sp. TS-13]|uniref:sensor histidine kinase n=1 Tax=Alkalihalobacillus sp. TS-13 TaxID=2842455 RepID=UPI001C88C5CC|nr:sensor histidine kinase [Alkalihalobacillus sp. TS-13]